MQYIALPDEKTRRLSFYLAMEEYVARRLNTADDCFFMWQVKPTVIFGRNQLIEAEVNLEFCRKKGIETYRRKSGGGCVYADMSNVMFSYVTRDEQVNLTFNRYINQPGIQRHNWFANRDGDLFFIYYEKDSKKNIIILEPSEEMAALIRGAVPRGSYEIN